ncbi:hypothetical protein EQG49_07070 [Periweissella cryptocerci]|uniref:ABC transporter substrate-binding protein n=1 Tax=Periweissella cryptocerci TaxID=2506420 RepID=A0A4P6YU48_9LACO|nr:ABC transporter substrate-binding protein [Periweissella cryptocerci]QBO36236.1 hypothetical protein EQG49_07070 [Periweissella cryptocerci]
MNKAYFELRAALPGQQIKFKTSDLEAIWFISGKQARRRLAKLQEQKLLSYHPGRGRGHLSVIDFTRNFQDEVTVTIQRALQLQDSGALLFIMQLDLPTSWLYPFHKAFEENFGFQPASGTTQILRQISSRPVTSLDPLSVSIYREAMLVKQIGDTLVNLEDGELVGNLAHHWQSNSDATTWTFYLRKGVKFHNDKQFTAHDVELTMQRVIHEYGSSFWQLENLQHIEVVDDYTIRFTFSQSEYLFARFLVDEKYTIVDYDIPFDPGHWVGTGPFMLKSNTPKVFSMVANENYFGFRALVDVVEYHVADLPKIADKIYNPNDFSDVEYQTIIKENKGAEFIIANMHRNTIIQDIHVREALYELIDATKLNGLHGRPASHYFAEDSVVAMKSVERAKEALKRSNYAGESLTVAVLALFIDAVTFGDAIKKAAKSIGININLIYYSFESEYYTDYLEKNADLVMLADIPVNDDALAYLEFVENPSLLVQRMLVSEQKKVLEKMLVEYKSLPTQMERRDVYLEIDNWLITNYYLIYTIHATVEAFVHPMLANVAKIYDYKNAWQVPIEELIREK